MPFSTNYVAGSLGTAGVTIPAGTERRNVPLLIRDALVGDANSRWTEVTGASPTPAFLQPYASTINTGNNTGALSGFTEHVTLYLEDDPALTFGTPGARMVRFWVSGHSVSVAIIDTVTADPGVADNWLQRASVTNSESSMWYLHEFGNWSSAGSSTTLTTSSTWGMKAQFYYALNDDYLWMGMWWPEKTNEYKASTGAYIWHPEPPANGTVARSDWPMIGKVPVGPHTGFDVFNVYYPPGPNNGRGTSSTLFRVGEPYAQDYQNREILVPLYPYYNPTTQQNWVDDGFLPGVKAVRHDLQDAGYLWHEFDVGGVPYLLVGNYKDSSHRYMVRMAA